MQRKQRSTRRPTRATTLLWLALSATGSVLLLAVTNHLTQNVASIPLLWLAPLTLYLLTFILAFEGGAGTAPRDLLERAAWCWLLGMAWLLVDADYQFDLAAAARHVPVGPVRRLHVLPRRALPRCARRRAT